MSGQGQAVWNHETDSRQACVEQRKDTPENSPISSVFLRPRLWDVQQFILIPT
ncbi:hypothetical protein ALO48_102583 [Pseudomonas syringae pv. rhaphiolepidis]|nr:hypothetical protein ALO48_102583 [Pseudomonas syringae pv. rhaphiolepidis]